MLEGLDLEIGVELTVEHAQDVLVELRRDSGGVVVGSLQPGRLLDQVGAEEETILGVEQARDPCQELTAGGGIEVADRPAEEDDQTRAADRDPLQVLLEVADHAADLEPWVLVDQAFGGLAGDLLGDVDRRVGLEAAGVLHGVEQVAGLRRRARAELDQGGGPAGCGDHLGRARFEDRALGPGRVVLGKLGDLLEELRSPLVVEVLRGQLLQRPAEADTGVGGEVVAFIGGLVHLDRYPLRGRLGFHSAVFSSLREPIRFGSVGLRRPWRSGCRRISGGARAGPSCGSWAGSRRGGSPRPPRAAPCGRARRRPRSTHGREKPRTPGRR